MPSEVNDTCIMCKSEITSDNPAGARKYSLEFGDIVICLECWDNDGNAIAVYNDDIGRGEESGT